MIGNPPYATWRSAIAIGLIVFAASWLTRPYPTTDAAWNVPVSLSLIHEGNIEISEFPRASEDVERLSTLTVNGRRYNFYPIGISLLAVPIVLIGEFLFGTNLALLQLLAARVIFALTASLFFLLLVSMGRQQRHAALLTGIFSFATINLNVLGGALWSHGGVELTTILVLMILVRAKERPSYVLLAAIPLGFMYTLRPTTTLFIIVICAYVVREHQRLAVTFPILVALIIAGFMGWSNHHFNSWLPPYYQLKLRIDPPDNLKALAGLLISPNRGLFIFMPVLAFCIPGWNRMIRSPMLLDKIICVMPFLHIVPLMLWPIWWGGCSFGPRLFADVMPFLVILLADALEIASEDRNRWFRRLFVTAAVLSMLVQIRGATSVAVDIWNTEDQTGAPGTGIDQRPERAWDWQDMQILRTIPE